MIQILITPDGCVRVNVDKAEEAGRVHIEGSEVVQPAPDVKPTVKKIVRRAAKGRKRNTFLTPTQKHQLVLDYRAGGLSINAVAKRYNVCRSTAYRLIDEANKNLFKEDKEEGSENESL